MCRVLNYFENFLIFVFAVSGFVSISVFVPLAGVPLGITSSSIVIKICAITAGIKKYKSIIKKKIKPDRIVLLTKTKLQVINVLISKALGNSNMNHEEFVSVNNVFRDYNKTKDEIKNPKNVVGYTV